MSPDGSVVIEVYGEGKTDVGHDPTPQRPTQGVIPILLHTLCGRPDRMLVKSGKKPYMHKGTLARKVKFAKIQARQSKSQGVVFVMDSEGDLKGRIQELRNGREMDPSDFPMAIGAAHPCVEAWLLADAAAIRRALGLAATPPVPESPESLPAPCKDRRHNPKTSLSALAGHARRELSVAEKQQIAAAMNDMDLVRTRCPEGFAPFADEVDQSIRPLF